MHPSDLKYFIRDIEFRWVPRTKSYWVNGNNHVNVTENELQYRVQKGDGFRGWSEWEIVAERKEADKPKADDTHHWG